MRVSPKPPDCPYSKEAQFPLLLSHFSIVILLVSSYPGLRKILDTLILWPGKFLMEIRQRVMPGIVHLGSSHPGFPSFYNKFITQWCNWCLWYSRMSRRNYSTNHITKVYRIWRTDRQSIRICSLYHTTTPISRDNYGEFSSLQDQWKFINDCFRD